MKKSGITHTSPLALDCEREISISSLCTLVFLEKNFPLSVSKFYPVTQEKSKGKKVNCVD